MGHGVRACEARARWAVALLHWPGAWPHGWALQPLSTATRQAKTGVQPVTPVTTHHDQGGIERVLLGVASLTDVWSFAALGKLPGGSMGPSGSSSGGSDSSGGANSASAAATAAPGGTLYALDESALMEGGAEGNRGSLVVRDSRIAIVGGTGR